MVATTTFRNIRNCQQSILTGLTAHSSCAACRLAQPSVHDIPFRPTGRWRFISGIQRSANLGELVTWTRIRVDSDEELNSTSDISDGEHGAPLPWLRRSYSPVHSPEPEQLEAESATPDDEASMSSAPHNPSSKTATQKRYVKKHPTAGKNYGKGTPFSTK